MTLSNFYEQYWQRKGGSPADANFALRQRQEKLKQALASVPVGSAILDAGCGNGRFSRFLSQQGYQISGIDISLTAVRKAHQLVPQGQFVVAALDAGLPFEGGKFAAIWCTEVLEHLFDVHAALSELNRVLKLGGYLLLTTPFHGLLKNLAIAIAGFERHYNPYVSHIRFFTRKSLRLCLERAGFHVLSFAGVGRWWPFWMSHFAVAQKAEEPRPAPEIIG